MSRRKLTDEEKNERAFNKEVNALKRNMELRLGDKKSLRIPEPPHIHSIGDRVVYGAWDWTGILDVIDGGKIYKCFSVTHHTGRNVPDKSIYKIHYVAWYEVLLYQTELPEILKENEDIDFNYQQREMSSLIHRMFDKYGIDLNPDYQRGNVWTSDQKVELIDSIFKNIDIGKFTVIKRPWGPNPNEPTTQLLYEMLDGKQRLTAIYEFFIGKFQYKGKYYFELHPRDRNHFRHYRISYVESSPLTNEQKYRYFLKLNTTGTPVDKEHLDRVKQLWLNEQKN